MKMRNIHSRNFLFTFERFKLGLGLALEQKLFEFELELVVK